ncbi:MAG: DUF1800 domain-containing protein [Gammaproteobacteria bacterium]|nr:DUF1800 domain-containing protein [Gammaproteobacteria bacterium]NNF49551.1 DUF1800 domain-containing protein [Woeseiaceae bacterium]MBT8093845.1 DUF1800 domain-containing protein [Gammaproteobacteria bacterium]MBT8105812.1 DUF1800 domain-containing protein [Gammaproteobacteria bacterium]NNK25826.1 DUF1800 domain-containing protein [Woeseiaceae bacterium]
MGNTRILGVLGSILLGLAGCGGGSSATTEPPPPPPPPPPIEKAEAFQFLNQSTFGATEAEAGSVIARRFPAWISSQMRTPASLQLPHMLSLPPPQFMGQLHADRVDIWFRNSLTGSDQLRQRVAFALSEIMVVSQLGALQGRPFAVADYYDMLARNAFGNYRDLIEDVTLHPAMGVYLSMLGNRRPDPVLNIRPDENYARELMQLFSIGLVELNIDGSDKLDANSEPIPTYDQAIIEGFAHVFTGWTWANSPVFGSNRVPVTSQYAPMELWPDFHDTGAKTLLDGVILPAGQSGEQDLSDALDNIFNHPNVGPFIAIRLIQRLTTSNPSPGYVQRVARVFNDNGSGVRGDLGAVVTAILLDEEARPALHMEIDGKLKEPLLRLTQLYRAYNATSQSGSFRQLFGAYIVFGQGPLQSPSVFNFFSPFYAPPGEIRDSSLVAPELEIATEYQNTFVTNYLFLQTFGLNHTNPDLEEDNVFIDIQPEMDVADNVDALIDMAAGKLLGGEISDTLRTEIQGMLERVPPEEAALRAAETIYLIAASPEYAYQL